MSDLRRSVSPRQLELLLQYLEQHPTLAMTGPRSRHDRLQARRFWEKVARTLNKVDGKAKSGRTWCRYWVDLKCKTRRKYKSNKQCYNPQMFTQWEQRIINLLTDEHGNLLPNAHQQADTDFMDITKSNIHRKIKRTFSDDEQDISQESNTKTYEHTDKKYVTDDIEHTNDHKTLINKTNDENIKIQSGREMYTLNEQNTSLEDEYNSISELNSNIVHNNNELRHNYSTLEHNNGKREHIYITAEHNGRAESTTKKTIEELKKEILEFQLKKQKELFEREKIERYERHKLEMEILRLKRDILVKELNDLT